MQNRGLYHGLVTAQVAGGDGEEEGQDREEDEGEEDGEDEEEKEEEAEMEDLEEEKGERLDV